jgi:hypothetical protein
MRGQALDICLKNILFAAVGIVINIIIPTAGFKIIKKWDNDNPPTLTGNAVLGIFAAALPASVYGLIILARTDMQSTDGLFMYILLQIFSGCLLFACATDLMINKVYDFIWWAAAPPVILIYCSSAALPDLRGLVLFIIIQENLCCRLYGRADCHAFCMCAAAGSSLGLGTIDFCIHMILSFLILAIVQRLKKNVAPNGRLNKPVAFMPYITAAFWMTAVLTLTCI